MPESIREQYDRIGYHVQTTAGVQGPRERDAVGWFEENISQVSTWAFLGPRGGGGGGSRLFGVDSRPEKGSTDPLLRQDVDQSFQQFARLPVKVISLTGHPASGRA